MGTELMPLISWLDQKTAGAIADIVQSVADSHPEVQAAILFGSVARHKERPLDDPQPSDVDVLLVIDPAVLDLMATRLSHDQVLALTHTIGEADYRNRTAPREVKVLFIDCDLVGWDPLFIENVARDGVLLWGRGPLPDALTPVAKRTVGRRIESSTS